MKEIWTAVLIFLIVVAAFILPVYAVLRVNEVQLTVTCSTSRASIEELRALRQIARELGLPGDFPIHPLPEECR